MKKNLWAVLLGTCLLSATAAHAEGTYFSVGAGRSEYKFDGESENKTAISLAFGQSLGENWGYEIGYVNFGSLRAEGEYLNVPYSMKLRAQSVYAAAVGTLPVSESFAVFAKLGVSANYAKAESTATDGFSTVTVSDSETKFGPMVGLGVSFQFTKEIAGVAEYRYFDKITDGELKASALTAGIRYHF